MAEEKKTSPVVVVPERMRNVSAPWTDILRFGRADGTKMNAVLVSWPLFLNYIYVS